MGLTNIEIDEKLIASVMRRHGLRTKRDAVDFALRRAAGAQLTEADLRDTAGVGWGDPRSTDSPLGALRSGDAPPEPW